MKHSLCNIPDIIIHNACVHLLDDENSTEQAIAVSDGKILAVGNNSEILSLAGEDTKIINADGASVIPGINDSHCHMWEAGMLMEGIITFGIPSIKELAELVGEYTKKMQPGQWLQGGSWIASQFVEGRMPTKYDLDPYSPENPVV